MDTDRIDELFLDELHALKENISAQDPYRTLMVAASIAKLFLDGGKSLAEKVNSARRLKLLFSVADQDSPYRRSVLADNPQFYSVQDGLDPETQLALKTYHGSKSRPILWVE